jgi:hypothetical protein
VQSPALHPHVPVALIAGNRGTSSISADLGGLLRAAGRRVGLAAPERLAAGSERAAAPRAQRRTAALPAPSEPRAGVLVAAASPARIVRRGLCIDRLSVAAIADSAPPVDEDAFRRGIEVVLKATSGFVVIDADNAAAVAATRPVDRARLVLCARRENEAVRQHAALGGPIVVRAARDGGEHVELRSAGKVLARAAIRDARDRLPRRARARMFAVALAFGLGLSSRQIAAAAERRDHCAVPIGYERAAAIRAARAPASFD